MQSNFLMCLSSCTTRNFTNINYSDLKACLWVRWVKQPTLGVRNTQNVASTRVLDPACQPNANKDETDSGGTVRATNLRLLHVQTVSNQQKEASQCHSLSPSAWFGLWRGENCSEGPGSGFGQQKSSTMSIARMPIASGWFRRESRCATHNKFDF